MKNTLAEILDAISPLYEKYEESLDSQIDWLRLQQDKKYGVIEFFRWYGFERSGASKELRLTAIKFLNKYYDRIDSISKEKINILREFQEKKWNENNNPLFSPELVNLDIPATVQYVKDKQFQQGYEDLIKQRGIGHKIASLFLRDVSLKLTSFKKSEIKLQDAMYLFPVDVWVYEFMKALDVKPTSNIKTTRPKDMDKEKFGLSLTFCGECLNQGYDPRVINVCMWKFGAYYAGNTDRLKKVINDGTNTINEEIKLIDEF